MVHFPKGAVPVVLVAAAFAWSVNTRRADPLPEFPRVVLWAWERPEDLRFASPAHAGVAFLARTIWLDGARIASRPRLQPLQVAEGAAVMAVVRIESKGRGLPDHAPVIGELLQSARLPGVRALQVDFDARQSERGWYRT